MLDELLLCLVSGLEREIWFFKQNMSSHFLPWQYLGLIEEFLPRDCYKWRLIFLRLDYWNFPDVLEIYSFFFVNMASILSTLGRWEFKWHSRNLFSIKYHPKRIQGLEWVSDLLLSLQWTMCMYLTRLKENWWLLYQQHLLITISVACLQTSRARNSFEGITGSGSVSPRICWSAFQWSFEPLPDLLALKALIRPQQPG